MSDPLKVELQAVMSCLTWLMRTELGSLQGQFMFITIEQSLQPSHNNVLTLIFIEWVNPFLFGQVKVFYF